MAFESKEIKSDATTVLATIAVDTVSSVDYPVSQLIVGSDGGSKTLVDGTTGLPVTGIYSEDVATPSTIVGHAGLMERDDALSSLTPAEADWVGMRSTAEGALWTQDYNSDDMLTGIQLIDDAIYTDGSGTPSKGVLIMGSDATNPQALLCTPTGIQLNQIVTADGGTTAVHVDDAATAGPGAVSTVLAGLIYDDTTPDSVDEGDSGYQRMSANRNAYVQVRDAAGNERGMNVDSGGNVTVNLSATDNAVLDAMVVDLAAMEVLLTTIDSDTNAIKTAVEIIDNAISGSEMQVDLVSAAVTNAGTFVVQVDGDALTALQLIDDAIYADDADWTDSTSKHILTGGLYQSSPQSITDGDVGPLQVDANGRLIMSSTNALDVSAATVSVSGTVTANLSATDNAVLDNIQTAVEVIDNAVHVDDAAFTLGTHSGVMMMGFAGTQSVNANDAGAIAMETDGAVHIHDGGNTITVDGTVTANLSSTDNTVLDNIQTAVELIDNAISGSEMQVDVVGALPAGTAAIGKLAANSGVDIGDVDVTSISAGTNLIGFTGNAASASVTGTATYYDNDLDETKIEVTDNPNVRIYSIHAINTTAAPLYLQMWDLDSTSVTVGTTTPTNQYIIPGNADSDGAGFTISFNPPKSYSTGFTVAATTDSEGSAAPGANACHVNIEYISAA